jgi:hypothetical protein
MHDVAMRRRPAALVIAALLAMLVVGGAMLFGMGKPAQSQSVPEPPCNTNHQLGRRKRPNTPAHARLPMHHERKHRYVPRPT